jgi:hypothetical protein
MLNRVSAIGSVFRLNQSFTNCRDTPHILAISTRRPRSISHHSLSSEIIFSISGCDIYLVNVRPHRTGCKGYLYDTT